MNLVPSQLYDPSVATMSTLLSDITKLDKQLNDFGSEQTPPLPMMRKAYDLAMDVALAGAGILYKSASIEDSYGVSQAKEIATQMTEASAAVAASVGRAQVAHDTDRTSLEGRGNYSTMLSDTRIATQDALRFLEKYSAQ